MFDITRRRILSTAVAVGSLAVVRPALAIEPIVRPGRPRLRLSLAAYSFRQFLAAKRGETPSMTLPQFIDWAAAQDLDAVELTAYYFPPQPDTQYLVNLKRQCHIAGLDISSGAIGNNFTKPDGEEIDQQMAYAKSWIDHYAALGVPVIRVFAGVPPKGTSEQEGVERAVRNLRAACEYASTKGVILGLENHDYLTRIDRLIEIVQQIDSPWFGVNLDSANIADPEPYKAIEKLAPYAVNMQMKVSIPTGRGGREPCDYARVINILREARYSGYVVLEYEEPQDPYEHVPRELAKLRDAMG